MKKSRVQIFMIALFALIPNLGWSAPTVPQALSLGGELYLPDGTPVVARNVNFRVQVLDAAEQCVLYSEFHPAQDLSTTGGRFNLIVGSGSSIVNNVGTPGALDARIFTNGGLTPVANCASPTVALNAGDQRMVRIAYDLGSGYVALSPSVPTVATAYAMVADSLAGKAASDFLQIADSGSAALNQANAEYAFSASNWPRLKALLDGNSSQYLATTPSAPLDLNGQRITSLQDPTGAQDAVTKNYADTTIGGRGLDLSTIGPMTGDGSALVWDSAANRWAARTISTAPTGSAGGDLSGTYPNPTIANGAITSAKINSSGLGPNRLLMTDATTGNTVGFATCAVNEVFAWTASGWACTSVASLSPVVSVNNRTGAITLTAADVGGLGTASLLDHGTAANQVLTLDASARIPDVDGSLIANVNAVRLQGRDVASLAPATGQVLGWNGSAWVPTTSAAGSVTSLVAASGLLGGTITGSGTIAVDIGTTAGQIPQLDASARMPAVDGSLLRNLDASTIATRAVSTVAPLNGQVLGWNGSAWVPTMGAVGSVTSIVAASGLLGGTITGSGTIAVDVGSTAGKIPQLDVSARLPSVDGSLLRNVDAATIATRAVSTTAPLTGQVLGWNGTAWTPTASAVGSLTSIAAGTGLLGGTITDSGTLSIDVGTTAGQIPQLDASARLPSVDGSLLRNVDAKTIASRNVSTTAPLGGQVLGWNQTTSVWEPTLATAGSVTNVGAGDGLVGGPISSTGTLAVDVGSSAFKVLRENANAQIEQLFGSAGLPAYGFVGNAGTGVYAPAMGEIALSTNGVNRLHVDTDGNVGVGIGASGIAAMHVTSTNYTSFRVDNETAGQGAEIDALTYGAGSTGIFAVGSARGTRATPSYLLAGDSVGYYAFAPSQAQAQAGRIQMLATENWSNVNTPGQMSFATTPSGSTLPVERGVITSDGNFGFGTNSPQAGADFAFSGTAASAIIVPRDTQTNRPSNPVNGMIRYNTTSSTLEGFAGGSWGQILTGIPSNVFVNGGNSASAAMSLGTSNGQNLALRTNGSDRWTLDTNGNMTSNTTATGPQLALVNPFNRSILQMETYTNSTAGSSLLMRKGRGLSNTSPTTNNNNDILGVLGFKGYGGAVSSWNDVSYYDTGIEVRASEAFSTTAHGSRMGFYTTPIGTTTKRIAMTLDDKGFLGINNTLPGAVLSVANNSLTNAVIAIQGASAVNNAQNQGLNFISYAQNSANVNLANTGALIQNMNAISAGNTQAGTETGLNVNILRNGLGGLTDTGTVAYQYGVDILYGHTNVNAGQSPTTTNVTGLRLVPNAGSGSINRMVAIEIVPPVSSGATVATSYALYSGNTSQSYFAGNVGIGVATPSTALQVAGVIAPGADNTSDLGTTTLRFRNIYAANAAVQTSDARQKSNVRESNLGLDFVNRLRPVSFNWREGQDDEIHYGLIAQETQNQLEASGVTGKTGIVTHDESSDRFGMRYSELISPVIKAIHELYDMISGTKRELARLEAENERLKAQDAARGRELASVKGTVDKTKDDLLRENAELKARLERIERALQFDR